MYQQKLNVCTGMFFQSHYTRAQANSPRPVMTSSGPNPKSSPGMPASQQSGQSQQSPSQPVSQSHSSPGGGREQREHRGSRSSWRKGSDSSVPEEDKDKREEATGRGEERHRRCAFLPPGVAVVQRSWGLPYFPDYKAQLNISRTS